MRQRIGMLDVKAIRARVKARTAEIVKGRTYFLSSFHDVEGAYVEIQEISTKENLCGWNSSVTVKVISPVGDRRSDFYKPGSIHSVNACNLYERREDASHERKLRRKV